VAVVYGVLSLVSCLPGAAVLLVARGKPDTRARLVPRRPRAVGAAASWA
jgi:hypothetical protein